MAEVKVVLAFAVLAAATYLMHRRLSLLERLAKDFTTLPVGWDE